MVGERRLWSTKQEQEKVLDEDATKRKQESADAKVCPSSMHNAPPTQRSTIAAHAGSAQGMQPLSSVQCSTIGLLP